MIYLNYIAQVKSLDRAFNICCRGHMAAQRKLEERKRGLLTILLVKKLTIKIVNVKNRNDVSMFVSDLVYAMYYLVIHCSLNMVTNIILGMY